KLPRRTGSGGAAGCRRSACGCSVCQRGGSGHAGADAGAQGAGVLRDDLHRAAVVQPQQAQQALGVGDLAVGVVDAHVAVQAAGRMDDLVDLADVIDAYFLDHKGTFLSVRVWYGTLSQHWLSRQKPQGATQASSRAVCRAALLLSVSRISSIYFIAISPFWYKHRRLQRRPLPGSKLRHKVTALNQTGELFLASLTRFSGRPLSCVHTRIIFILHKKFNNIL